MGIRTRIKRWFTKQAARAVGLTFIPSWLRHSVMRITWTNLVNEGLKSNSTVFACMFLLTRAFPEPELWSWTLEDDREQKLPDHPWRALMRKPNPDMGEAELMQYVVTYASLSGNAYLWKQRGNNGEVVALWPFHDGDMQPIPGRGSEEGLVAYYVLDIGDGTRGNPWGLDRHDDLVGVAVPKSEIIHWKWMIDPAQPWRGIGALEAAAGDIDTANEIRNLIFSLLKNDAKPPLVINLAEGEEFTEEKADRLRAQWKKRFGGENRGLPAFLEFGMTVEELGYNFQELDMPGLRDGPDAAICAGFGIQPAIVGALVGLKHSGIQANFEEARRMMTELTLVPLWRSLASEITQSMEDERGYEGVILRHDLSQVEALQQNQDELWARVTSAWQAGLITRAQGLDVLGLPFGDGDHVYQVSLTTTFEPATAEGVKGRLPGGNGHGPTPVLPANGGHRHSGNGHRHGGHKAGDYFPYSAKAFPDGDGGAGQQQAPRAAYERQQRAVRKLRKVRDDLRPMAERQIEDYFEEWAERAVARLEEMGELQPETAGRRGPAKQLTEDDWRRLENLLFGQEDLDALSVTMEGIYVEVVSESWPVFNAMLDSTAAFDLTNPAVTEALAQAGTQVREISTSTRQQLRGLLQYGSENGWAIEDLVLGDDERPGIQDFIAQTYEGRAETIARTEMATAQQTAATSRYEQDGVEKVIVLDNQFDNSDPVCVELDGTVQTLSWAKQNPLQHPNCLIPGTKVAAPNVTAGFSRPFHGKTVTIHTAANDDLTVTPNHPVLTLDGWAAAGELKQGDYIVGCPGSEDIIVRFLDPHNDQIISSAENLFTSLRMSPGMTTAVVPGAPVDFHGDGADGDIDIVFVNRFLGNGFDSSRRKHADHLSLKRGIETTDLLDAFSTRQEFFMRNRSAANGFVCSREALHDFFVRESGHFQFPALAHASQLVPSGVEPLSKRARVNANIGTNIFGAFTGLIPSIESIPVQPIEGINEHGEVMSSKVFGEGPIFYSDIISDGADRFAFNMALMKGADIIPVELIPKDRKAALLKLLLERGVPDSDRHGDLADTLTVNMALMKVVDVVEHDFSGHVYNFSTELEWYVSNSIITHNCVRAFGPLFDE